MRYRNTVWHGTLLLIALTVCGCTKWNPYQAPSGFAVVREHSLGKVVFQNNLPVSSSLDFTITKIDGAPVARETIPPWVDLQRGALVPAGAHRFDVLAQPHAHPLGYQPKEVSFVETVTSKTVYYLVEKEGLPVLIEAHPETR